MAGRVSEAAKEFAGTAAGERIPAPSGLTKPEAAIWDTLVLEKPASWFTRDNVELLKLYCRSAAQLDWIADRIASTKVSIELAEGSNDLEAMGQALLNMTKFQNMEDKYGKNLMNVATKLRMTPQAQISAPAAGTKAKQSTATAKTYESEDLGDPYEEIEDEGAGASLMN